MSNGDRHLWKGVVAGAAGGLAASWVMNQFQTGWSKAAEKLQHSKTPQGEQERQSQSDDEDATMKTAAKISSRYSIASSRARKRESSALWCTTLSAPVPAQFMGLWQNWCLRLLSELGFPTAPQFSWVPMRSRCLHLGCQSRRRSILLRPISTGWHHTWCMASAWRWYGGACAG